MLPSKLDSQGLRVEVNCKAQEGRHPEQLVNDVKVRARVSPLQHGELLAKNQVLQGEAGATAEQPSQRPKQEQIELEHGAEL